MSLDLELNETATVKESLTVQMESNREVRRKVTDEMLARVRDIRALVQAQRLTGVEEASTLAQQGQRG